MGYSMKKKVFVSVGIVTLLFSVFLIVVQFSRNADGGNSSTDTSASASVDQNYSTADFEEWDSAEGNIADPESSVLSKTIGVGKNRQTGSGTELNSSLPAQMQPSGGNSSLQEDTIHWENTSGFDEGEWDIVG